MRKSHAMIGDYKSTERTQAVGGQLKATGLALQELLPHFKGPLSTRNALTSFIASYLRGVSGDVAETSKIERYHTMPFFKLQSKLWEVRRQLEEADTPAAYTMSEVLTRLDAALEELLAPFEYSLLALTEHMAYSLELRGLSTYLSHDNTKQAYSSLAKLENLYVAQLNYPSIALYGEMQEAAKIFFMLLQDSNLRATRKEALEEVDELEVRFTTAYLLCGAVS